MGVLSNSSIASHNLYYVKLLKECRIKALHSLVRVRRQHCEYSRDSDSLRHFPMSEKRIQNILYTTKTVTHAPLRSRQSSPRPSLGHWVDAASPGAVGGSVAPDGAATGGWNHHRLEFWTRGETAGCTWTQFCPADDQGQAEKARFVDGGKKRENYSQLAIRHPRRCLLRAFCPMF